jgi:predicted permease
MGLKSELFEAAIDSNSSEAATNTPALWLGWAVIIILFILAILLVRFIYRRTKKIAKKLRDRV